MVEVRMTGNYLDRLRGALSTFPTQAVQDLVTVLLDVRVSGGTVFTIGNGGSATTASHATLDWMLGSSLTSPSLRVVNLGESVSQVLATGNDIDFAECFSRPLRKLASARDVLIIFSASGNSPNLLMAAAAGKEIGLLQVAITGFDGGDLRKRADLSVHIPTDFGDYGVVEDLHLSVVHMVKESLIAAGRI